ncbi:hypothetical protein [Cognatishimia sp. F0-27]|uniref:hypothetical protein n=1 Tax=Cognatishimia sp. F0-27 TaxID=2816855 RepID=UPI001D0C2231|nr:hypothetical protein [Cognatishimia sp. F0-27]MCC1494186.1 hypothetical protein [Cognatishimia sp. F0-27]
MAESKTSPPGFAAGSERVQTTGFDIVAVALSAIWVLLSGSYFLFGSGLSALAGELRFILVLMIVVFPVALIWVASMAARSSAAMREDSARLQAAIDALRHAYVAQAQQGSKEAPNPMLVKRLDEIAAAQRGLENALAMIASGRIVSDAASMQAAHPPETQDDSDQPALSLGTPAEALEPPLPNADFIRALHFPETAEDREGFAALRRALKDRNAAQLVQASQDVLTLLSQEGIYMDDLAPDLARPEQWRAFAQGARGREIAALGGVRDRASLALAAGRMKQDPIFRDAAHHFLRRFDRSFAAFEQGASDAEITEFAGTRTARAFMLLGRVAGTFD